MSELEELNEKINSFNNHLIKLLNTGEPVEKIVTEKELEVIKFAKFNQKLLCWFLSEKIMLLLRHLIQVGREIGKKIGLFQLDLISFNVSDLLRGMVFGDKNDLITVFNNLKKLDQTGRITIIKIKNRLESPLNDAMVIFKITESFLICELQMVLNQSTKATTDQREKSKIVLNHFFYELERSPYGVLSELSILLAYKDTKINFEENIRFETKEVSMSECAKNHPAKVIETKIQKSPFICSYCARYR